MTSGRKPTPTTPFLALALGTAVAFAASAAHGQDVSISCTVADTTDSVLPSVTVEVRDATGGGDVSVADATGQRSFSRFAPRTQELTLSRPGFNAPARVVETGAGNIADLMPV